MAENDGDRPRGREDAAAEWARAIELGGIEPAPRPAPPAAPSDPAAQERPVRRPPEDPLAPRPPGEAPIRLQETGGSVALGRHAEASPHQGVAIGEGALTMGRGIAIGAFVSAKDMETVIGPFPGPVLRVTEQRTETGDAITVTKADGSVYVVLSAGPAARAVLAKVMEISDDGTVEMRGPVDKEEVAQVTAGGRHASLESVIVAMANEIARLRFELERVKTRLT